MNPSPDIINILFENRKRKLLEVFIHLPYELRCEISINVVCVTSKGSDQPVHMHRLIGAFASGFNFLLLLDYCLKIILSF